MKFEQVIEALREGKCCFRDSKNFTDRWVFVFKQVPNEVEASHINNMRALSEEQKRLILNLRKGRNIKYCDQLCAIQANGRIDNYVPTVSDIFAEDWVIIEPELKNECKDDDGCGDYDFCEKEEIKNKLLELLKMLVNVEKSL